jgi:hypothetical protein
MESSLKKMRGEIIDLHNTLDLYINDLIVTEIKPHDIDFFKNYLLNTSVITSGAKIKILNQILIKNCFNDSGKILDILGILGIIRNAFAHTDIKITSY